MHLRLCAIALFSLHLASAQEAGRLQNELDRVLPDFQYRQEVKNFILFAGGEFTSGLRNGQDSLSLGYPAKKKVMPFLLSRFEVRNKDYRKFVDYVRDSIVHTLLGHFVNDGNGRRIDWKAIIDWKDNVLDSVYLVMEERIFGRPEIDVSKMLYRTSRGEAIAVYPDTLCWIRDFAYSYNEPMTKRYFRHPAFNNYPVVGITQVQALAYCEWKTRQWNDALAAINETRFKFAVRLPSAEEWEFAAHTSYPLYVLDSTQTKSYPQPMGGRGTNFGYRYNFGKYFKDGKEQVKSYFDDGYFYTAPCNTYKPDSNGMYNLLGNVAEWTSSRGSYLPVYNSNGENTELKNLCRNFPGSPFNGMDEKSVNEYLNKYIIVKGGAWSDEDFYLQPGVNQYYLPGEGVHSYIGFRVAVEIILNE